MKTIILSIKETLLPCTGLEIFGTGMHRDPLSSNRGHVVTRMSLQRESLSGGN